MDLKMTHFFGALKLMNKYLLTIEESKKRDQWKRILTTPIIIE